MGARVAPPIPETEFGRDAGHKRGDDYVTRASDAMDRGHDRHEQRIEREAGERSRRLRPRVRAREGHRPPPASLRVQSSVVAVPDGSPASPGRGAGKSRPDRTRTDDSGAGVRDR